MMADEGERLARMEERQRNMEYDIREIRADIKSIESQANAQSAGLSRPEKIALWASGSAVVGAVLGIVTLLSGGH